MQIKIISASAGSGKTYRLSEVLADRIVTGKARPEAVVATTFTRKAAAELEERVRVRLLESGRTSEARRLAAARLGTVNAVCGQIVSEFAFDLGLSPSLRVLDEPLAEAALRQSLAEAIDPPTRDQLAELSHRLEDFQWQLAVQSVIHAARTNGIDRTDLDSCRQRSVEGQRRLYGLPTAREDDLDRALRDSAKRMLDGHPSTGDTTKTTRNFLGAVREVFFPLRRGDAPGWGDWVRVLKRKVGKKSRDLAAPVKHAAERQDGHPRLHRDVENAVDLVFRCAADALKAYQQHKEAWGVLDFADQETLALELLGQPHVQERLRGEIDLVLVDEFQDTSPIQLAIFLRLAELAEESIWVGDQKQSIYGFRGADPALMDAAVVAITASDEPETLQLSWRSRPELVTMTSAVFGRAFPAQGIPENRVRLEAAPKEFPQDLGPAVEHWILTSKNLADDAHAVASCVRQLLRDDSVRVRDSLTEEPRLRRPGDVAILCRTHEYSIQVANALTRLGIQAVVPRPGLFLTPEGRVCLRALQLFVDPYDSLAAAELGRYLVSPEDPSVWFERVAEAPYARGFDGLEEIRAIRRAREAAPTAGALDALDSAMEAVNAADLCHRWGDTERRLTNLERLREHALTYAEHCKGTATACTPTGLVAWCLELLRSGDDTQAALPGEDTVTVDTWHAAKGREWPITVLTQLAREPSVHATGVHVVSDRDEFDASEPLAGRWIRYWQNPYHPAQNGMPFHERLAEDPATQELEERERRQELRLLYVGWTRARDRLVLAARPGDFQGGMLSLLVDSDDQSALLTQPSDGAQCAVWAGVEVDLVQRTGTTEDPIDVPAEPGAAYVIAGPRDYPPATRRPSDLPGSGDVGEPETIGERLALKGRPESDALGEAIHGFLAVDRPGLSESAREELAVALLERWDVREALEPAALLEASGALRRWIDARWPGAVWRREWPVFHRLTDGSLLRGFADLVLETADEGFVVIDHKSFPGSSARAVERARTYGGQVQGYVDAVAAATGRRPAGAFVHLPVSGVVVGVGP